MRKTLGAISKINLLVLFVSLVSLLFCILADDIRGVLLSLTAAAIFGLILALPFIKCFLNCEGDKSDDLKVWLLSAAPFWDIVVMVILYHNIKIYGEGKVRS